MKALLQRVTRASVSVEGEIVGQIGEGLVVLVGVEASDTEADAQYLAEKTGSLRIFDDENGKFNFSALDVHAEILVISQFTLLANTRRGRRPSFTEAAPPDKAEALIEVLIASLRSAGLNIATGRFRANMLVDIHNNGPVTIPLDSKDSLLPRRTA